MRSLAIRTDKVPGAPAAMRRTAGAEGTAKGVFQRIGRSVWRRLPRKWWAKAAARRWWVTAALYGLMLAILLAGGMPERLELEEGQVAPFDVTAPRDVVDRFRTQPLREEAARQAIREAAQDPANFDINPAVALQREEWVQAVFRVVKDYRRQLVETAPPAAPEAPVPQGPGVDDATAEPTDPSVSSSDFALEAGTAVGVDGTAVGVMDETVERPLPGAAADRVDGGALAGDAPAFAEAAAEEDAGEGAAAAIVVAESDVEAVRNELARDMGVIFSRTTVRLLLEASDAEVDELEALATRYTVDILSQRRIGDDDLSRERRAVGDALADSGVEPEYMDVLAEVTGAALVPNLILSADKVEKARQEAMRSVQDVIVREGQIIVRRGDPVEREHILLLNDLGMLDGGGQYGEWLGTALLLVALFAFVGAYARQFYPPLVQDPRLLLLFGLTVLLVTGLARVAALVPWDGALYLVPVALASMLVALLLDSRLALIASIVLAVVVVQVSRGEAGPTVIALAGGFAGVLSVSKVSQRSDLTRAGFIIGGASTFVMFALALTRFIPLQWDYAFLGIVNGLMAAVGTIGLLPYLEDLFGITSTIRLLELSNPNQPLLRKLLMEAPGTYHHSMIVGNLSEAAADAIGADSLLVRVGALYHDIGKTKRPYFFAENQFGADNPHDKISPSLSTLIIVSHVKDGVEMAREHRLPEVLISFIREHHGTALVRYFYQKAVEQGKGEPVDPKDFSYPGPKPQSRETAIVMLADAVEAAVRAMPRPSPGRIEGLVRKIVKERLAEGELDESDLTLKDLERISDAFVRVLTGIYHKRVEYPELTGAEGDKKSE